MDAWYSFIAEVGFPVAVTFYLLHRIEGKLNLLIQTIQGFPNKMSSEKHEEVGEKKVM